MSQKRLSQAFAVECQNFITCHYRTLFFKGLIRSDHFNINCCPSIPSVKSLQRKRPDHFRKSRAPLLILLGLIFGFQLPSTAFAHRGAVDEIDPCRIKIGNEWVHFTAYTPQLTAGKGYCRAIPQVGVTNLVFDYEGKELRHVSVEFEITKEPEGTRVFYQEPKQIQTGTVNGVVDFGKFGPGNYLAHVTISDRGEKIDKHVPFSVGIEDESEGNFIPFLIFVSFLILAILIMLWMARSKRGKPSPPAQTEQK